MKIGWPSVVLTAVLGIAACSDETTEAESLPTVDVEKAQDADAAARSGEFEPSTRKSY